MKWNIIEKYTNIICDTNSLRKIRRIYAKKLNYLMYFNFVISF